MNLERDGQLDHETYMVLIYLKKTYEIVLTQQLRLEMENMGLSQTLINDTVQPALAQAFPFIIQV